MVLGLVACWLAGAIAARTPQPGIVGPLASVPGGLLLAGANAGLDHGWVPVVIVVGTAVIGGTAADLDRRGARFGLGPLLFFVAVGGIYFTVPDTELMRAIVGVSLPLVLLAWPYAAAALGAGGAYAAVGLLLWIAPIEGIGRPGAIVGVVGAFALLVGEPLGRALVPRIQARARLEPVPDRLSPGDGGRCPGAADLLRDPGRRDGADRARRAGADGPGGGAQCGVRRVPRAARAPPAPQAPQARCSRRSVDAARTGPVPPVTPARPGHPP